MSNEVIKEAEDKAEKQAEAVDQNNVEAAAVKAETEKAPSEAESTADAGAAAPTEEPQAAAEPAKAPEASPVTEEPAAEQEASSDQTSGGEMDFGAILEQFEQDQVTYSTGELVTGKVVGISEHGALIDFGYKSEGLVSTDEFTDDEGEVTIKMGDEVEVVIRSMGSGDAPPSLSRFDAERRKSWNEIEQAYDADTPIKGNITAKTKGGLKVDINGVEAFLPGSQVDSRPVRNLDSLIGEEIEAKVIKFSRKRSNIVISRKVITDETLNKEKAATLERIEEGYIEEGIVKNLTDYGAFIDIGGIDGLLHVTDMSWGRLHNPGEMFKVGDTVQVKILKLDRDKEKVSLGFKQLLPDPWSTVTELYPVDSVLKGRVSSITEYGAFVELEPGVEGLVHVSEMSWSKRLKHPKHVVKKNDEVEVQVLGIDPDERRISLGMKQLQPNPWDTIAERYSAGMKIEGKVRNLTDFGAFVEVEEGIDGLVHVSDISWSKKIKHPKDVLNKGQEVEAVITNIDTDGHRLSLSMKELTPSAWEQFTNEHKPGDVIKGKISRFASFGVFVELAQDLEGLCHISELSDDRIENPEDEFSIGQELEFKILRIEHDVEKIGLSHRAVGKDDEPVMDSRSYSSQAKSGMASLGELAKLKFGSDESEGSEETEAKAEAPAEKSKADDKPDESKAEEAKAEEVKAEEAKAEESKADKKEEEVKADSSDDKADDKAKAESAEEEAKADSSDEKAKAEAAKEEAKVEATETGEKAEAKAEAEAEEKKEEPAAAEEKAEKATKAKAKEAKAEKPKEEVKEETVKSEKSDKAEKDAKAEESAEETKAEDVSAEAKTEKKSTKKAKS
ncbi:MAG: 30S ribosomal protein S1 [Acidobacteria bacterium]|nr:MAG: 30S ribosomal protein S1 [Acidobacteriota bacterium]REK01799.1 MAG: 30S ribosomal protein S1 [Acidobacteriota bacterium]REK14755.1 MAG: 30S ribosomal protein S1 [Acidobacteriota bacterium]REK45470.1 MAG: 30S ribosomal protein S1 [Acidobacteriota bacterium]